jgi:hypothetical protein
MSLISPSYHIDRKGSIYKISSPRQISGRPHRQRHRPWRLAADWDHVRLDLAASKWWTTSKAAAASHGGTTTEFWLMGARSRSTRIASCFYIWSVVLNKLSPRLDLQRDQERQNRLLMSAARSELRSFDEQALHKTWTRVRFMCGRCAEVGDDMGAMAVG